MTTSFPSYPSNSGEPQQGPHHYQAAAYAVPHTVTDAKQGNLALRILGLVVMTYFGLWALAGVMMLFTAPNSYAMGQGLGRIMMSTLFVAGGLKLYQKGQG